MAADALSSSRLPPYACVILQAATGASFLLEGRPHSARYAPGQLTCFGGHRRAYEEPEECARRELLEELHWEPEILIPRVHLWVNRSFIALFYHAAVSPDQRFETEHDREAVWIRATDLNVVPVNFWHFEAIKAHLGSEGEVCIRLMRHRGYRRWQWYRGESQLWLNYKE